MQFHPAFNWPYNYLSIWEFKLTHVNKRGSSYNTEKSSRPPNMCMILGKYNMWHKLLWHTLKLVLYASLFLHEKIVDVIFIAIHQHLEFEEIWNYTSHGVIGIRRFQWLRNLDSLVTRIGLDEGYQQIALLLNQVIRLDAVADITKYNAMFP